MTIKTQEVEGQTRIITKEIDGETKISCECCVAEGCCPYAADQLGIGYLEEDLPDTIIYNPCWDGGCDDPKPPPQTATRSGTTYTTPSYQVVIFGNTITTTSSIRRGIDDVIVEETLVWGPYDENSLFGGLPCLFNVLNETPTNYDNFEWHDNFLDEYDVSTSGGSFTITRDSLCTWSGTDPNYNGGSTVTLRLNTPSAGRGRANMWTMSGAGRTDAGPYKSPVGTYGTSYVWTVSE
jgi:hypothetical protein